MTEFFSLTDDLGPAKVIHISNAEAGLKAIVVIDNIAAGPSIGGTRMAPDVTLDECMRLARAMTLKNAAAGLPHGGGKSVIMADPDMPAAQKEGLMRAFADAIAGIADYIPGPDMGTNEVCMGWVLSETGRAVGLPRVLGGIPLDEIGATGYGISVAAQAAEPFCDVTLKGARVAIQGFGAVGTHAALCLQDLGAKLVAVSDSHGTVRNPEGLPLADLIALKQRHRSVTALPGADTVAEEAAITADCDILIPAARPDAIHPGNAAGVKARLILEGANIPASAEIEKDLHDRGVMIVPDFIANAGGVICAAVEYQGGLESQAMQVIGDKIALNTREVLTRARDKGVMPRDAATEMAAERVKQAMALQRRFG
ncbi:Glu/Leu/Phe/Val family dehydrogenase [Thalassovita aquimarina]|uniref:Glu/Leu/Phe/Val family dehydrogenase n=1 Tax=Thalassovita aquimarina TaxID=2785917 RepID=UPI00356800B6